MQLVIFTDIVPLRQRSKYYAIIQLAWSIGTVGGPLIGGAIAQKTTWRWIFYINFPLCVIGFGMVAWAVKIDLPKTTFREKVLRTDWIGGFLFTASIVSILVPLTWGGISYAWQSWHTVVPLVIGAVGLVITILWETYGTQHPFLKLVIFHNITANAAFICTLLQGLIVCYSQYYLSCRLFINNPFRSSVDYTL
jgi:MFS family permease